MFIPLIDQVTTKLGVKTPEQLFELDASALEDPNFETNFDPTTASSNYIATGGGPAGLYFSLLMKKADPGHDITVVERNRADDTFGFGVVFSDATLESFADADRDSYTEITASFAHWDAIDIHYRGKVLTSRGHGFAGITRQRLLDIRPKRVGEELQRVAEALAGDPRLVQSFASGLG